jgi:hypothetical protein
MSVKNKWLKVCETYRFAGGTLVFHTYLFVIELYKYVYDEY